MFNVISGFYKPETGVIKFENQDITNTKTHIRASKGLARTFQNISLFQTMSVLDKLL